MLTFQFFLSNFQTWTIKVWAVVSEWSKEIDLKSIGLCSHRFESCRQRHFFVEFLPMFFLIRSLSHKEQFRLLKFLSLPLNPQKKEFVSRFLNKIITFKIVDLRATIPTNVWQVLGIDQVLWPALIEKPPKRDEAYLHLHNDLHDRNLSSIQLSYQRH